MIAQADIRQNVPNVAEAASRGDTGIKLSRNARKKLRKYGHIPIVLREGLDIPPHFVDKQIQDVRKLIYKKPDWKPKKTCQKSKKS